MAGTSSFAIWNAFNSWANTFQGGFYRPQTDFIIDLNNISNKVWTELTDEAENNQSNQDDLTPFLKTKNCIVLNTLGTYGMFANPDDYGAFSSARLLLYEGKTVGDKDCETCGSKPDADEEEKYQMVQRYLDGLEEVDCSKINNSKWAACLAHLTKAPTLSSPKITQISFADSKGNLVSGFKVAPRRVSVIVLDYYTSPVDATFDFTIAPGNVQTGAGDQIIYNATTSIPLQWKPSMIDEFVIRLGERYGIFTRDQFLFQAARAEKTK